MKKSFRFVSLMLAAIMLIAVMPAALAQEQVTIRFSWWGGDTRHAATLKAIALFEEKYPNIHVEPEYGGWDSYNQKIFTQLVGGTEADLIQCAFSIPEVNMQGTYFVDLYEHLDKIDTANLDMALIESLCVYDGKLQGISGGKNAFTMLQNTAMLKANGVDIPEKWTWENALVAAEQLHTANPDAYLFNYGNEIISKWLLPMYMQQYAGGVVVTDEYVIDYPVEALVSYFTWVENMFKVGGFQPFEEVLVYNGAPESNPKWAEGNLAFSFFSSASYNWYVFNDYLAQSTEVVDMLRFDESAGAKNDSMYSGHSMSYVVSPHTKHLDETLMLLNFIVNDPDAGLILGTERALPINQEITNLLAENGLLQEGVAKAAEFASTRVRETPGTPSGNSELLKLIEEYLQMIEYGQMSAEDAAKECYEEIGELLLDLKASANK